MMSNSSENETIIVCSTSRGTSEVSGMQCEEECEKSAAELHDEMLFKQPEGSHLGDCPIVFCHYHFIILNISIHHVAVNFCVWGAITLTLTVKKVQNKRADAHFVGNRTVNRRKNMTNS